jgi:hypothetical protein
VPDERSGAHNSIAAVNTLDTASRPLERTRQLQVFTNTFTFAELHAHASTICCPLLRFPHAMIPP